MTMVQTIGIDLGSRTTKIVLFNGQKILRSQVFETTPESWETVKKELNKHPDLPAMATGYGRHFLSRSFQTSHVTEINACASGAFHLFPSCRTILDVGGQDCKLITLDGNGRMDSFEMNDRCAAGTGRFLEKMAQTLHLDLPDFVRTALCAQKAVSINSMCTVFAESEVISLITSGHPKEEIALGLHQSIVKRLEAMFIKTGMDQDILFVGGGALNDCLHQQLEARLKTRIHRPENTLTVTALGAALLAARH